MFKAKNGNHKIQIQFVQYKNKSFEAWLVKYSHFLNF